MNCDDLRDIDREVAPVGSELSDEEVLKELHALRARLGKKVVLLGHHYQSDDVIELADFRGDSLALAKDAAKLDAPYIVFLGVKFMAETADMLTKDNQLVILPDMKAGCSMADMANEEEVNKAWEHIASVTAEKIVPVTYVNCSAELKAFVGENGGSICTSSNAKGIISWALNEGEKLFFFPDQHLGRNTCYELGISLNDMITYDPSLPGGGVTDEQIKNAKVILWYGYCSVHQNFTKDQIKRVKRDSPETTVIVHPECCFDVVSSSDLNGSTSYIIKQIADALSGSKFAVGTEFNLVNRLSKKFADKKIEPLSLDQCLCSTMYRIRPRWLLASLKAIEDGAPINVVSVSKDTKSKSLKALNRMLAINT